jgi:hypothetical protein
LARKKLVTHCFKKMIDKLQYILDDWWVNCFLLNNFWSNTSWNATMLKGNCPDNLIVLTKVVMQFYQDNDVLATATVY